MKKSWIFLVGILFIILVSFGAWLSYQEQKKNAPKKPVQELFETSGSINEAVTQDLIKEINNSGASDKTFLSNGVSNYATLRKVGNIIIVSEDGKKATVRADVLVTTKNTKTGFTVATTDIYELSLVKIADEWKINEVKLLKSMEK